MPKALLRSNTAKTRRRPRGLFSRATLAGHAGLIGLAATALAAGCLIVAAVAGTFLAGVLLGAGIVGITWELSRFSRGWAQSRRPARIPGRSRTRDCRQARWARPPQPIGIPHPPTEAQRRVRPCPGSRRP